MNRFVLWDLFCHDQGIGDSLVPLFETRGGCVQTFRYGRDQRLVLRRSSEMEARVRHEAALIQADYADRTDRYEGLIYLMATRRGERVVPLYIGKAEKYGKGDNNLTGNIATSPMRGRFCRWGYAYAYHMGDLSAAACPGHDPRHQQAKYLRWSQRLFVSTPSESPELREPILFWAKAWPRGGIGIWEDWDETSLTFREYLLVGVAADLFPNDLLNTDGVNRR